MSKKETSEVTGAGASGKGFKIMDRARGLLAKFQNGEMAIGGHVFLTDPSISEAMASFGYDFVWIDAEHGPFDKERLLAHIVFANAGGSAAIVRVVSNDAAVIKPVLEMGPDGIIIPMVCSRKEAEQAVAACRYPPRGVRGFGPRRANKYGVISSAEYLAKADSSFLRMVQIEHVEAVRNIDGILSVAGIDAVIIGPNDLSASMGRLGDASHPDVLALCDTVIARSNAAGKPCGVSIGPADRENIRLWMGKGIDFISCGDDISYLAMGAASTLQYIRSC